MSSVLNNSQTCNIWKSNLEQAFLKHDKNLINKLVYDIESCSAIDQVNLINYLLHKQNKGKQNKSKQHKSKQHNF